MFLKYFDFLYENKNNILKKVAWAESAYKFAFNLNFPITPKVAKEFYNTRITCFHITGYRQIPLVKALLNSKKTISAFTQMDEKILSDITGVQTTGGLVFEIDGNTVFKGNFDLMSMPDDIGRRWIDFFDGFNKQKNIIPKIDKRLESFRNKLTNQIESKFGLSKLTDILREDKERTPEENKILQQFLAYYIPITENFLIENKQLFIELINQDFDYGWNEVLVNDVKVKNIICYVNHDKDVHRYFNSTIMYELKDIYGDDIEKMQKDLRSIASEEVYITNNSDEIVKFVKERGGKIIY